MLDASPDQHGQEAMVRRSPRGVNDVDQPIRKAISMHHSISMIVQSTDPTSVNTTEHYNQVWELLPKKNSKN